MKIAFNVEGNSTNVTTVTMTNVVSINDRVYSCDRFGTLNFRGNNNDGHTESPSHIFTFIQSHFTNRIK